MPEGEIETKRHKKMGDEVVWMLYVHEELAILGEYSRGFAMLMQDVPDTPVLRQKEQKDSEQKNGQG